jgi:hypothetical protein
MLPPERTSDTITITPDGRAVVDVRKLLAKPRMQEMIRAMRDKTRFVPSRREPNEPLPPESSTNHR